jgi:5-methylcytosine-specific restriction protein A
MVSDRSGARQLQRRTQIARSSMSRRPSAKLVKSREALTATRALTYTREQGSCARCSVGRADELHHRLPRGMGGSSANPDAHALSRTVWICRDCHRDIESNRTQALAQGWLIARGVDHPSVVPLWYRGRWVLLDDDGGVTAAVRDTA